MFENYLESIRTGISVVNTNMILQLFLMIYMAIAVYTDMSYMKIRDSLNVSFWILRYALMAFGGFIGTVSGVNLHLGITSMNWIGLIVGCLLILVPAVIVMKPMGGDIKFSTVLGFWIGDAAIICSLLVAVILFFGYALIIKRANKKTLIPFAPFICLGFSIVMLIASIQSNIVMPILPWAI